MTLPSLQVVRSIMRYVDHKKSSVPRSYTREQAIKMLPRLTARAQALTNCTHFPAKPNRINCLYCPYGPTKGNGQCEHGVEA
jgi:hypothetical protein